MEETWELAVVSSAINPNETVSVVIKEDLRSSNHDWDWSPKHTRLKYQMVTTCVIFFSMCVFKFTETSIPLLGWKIKGDVSGLVIIGTFLFSIMSIWSFSLRSKIEEKELSPSGNYLYNEFRSVNSKIGQLKSNLASVSKPNFTKLQEIQDIVKNNSDYIRQNCIELSKNAEILSRLPLLLDQRLSLIKASNELYSQTAIEDYKKGKTQEQIQKLDQSLFYDNMQEPKNNNLAKIPEVKKEIDELNKSEQFLEAINLHTVKEAPFLNHLESAKRMIDVHETKMDSFVEGLESTTQQVVSLNENVEDFIRQGNLSHREVAFDRKWLSYRIPLTFSIFFLLVGTPLGIGKIANSLLQQKYCWCIL